MNPESNNQVLNLCPPKLYSTEQIRFLHLVFSCKRKLNLGAISWRGGSGVEGKVNWWKLTAAHESSWQLKIVPLSVRLRGCVHRRCLSPIYIYFDQSSCRLGPRNGSCFTNSSLFSYTGTLHTCTKKEKKKKEKEKTKIPESKSLKQMWSKRKSIVFLIEKELWFFLPQPLLPNQITQEEVLIWNRH